MSHYQYKQKEEMKFISNKSDTFVIAKYDKWDLVSSNPKKLTHEIFVYTVDEEANTTKHHLIVSDTAYQTLLTRSTPVSPLTYKLGKNFPVFSEDLESIGHDLTKNLFLNFLDNYIKNLKNVSLSANYQQIVSDVQDIIKNYDVIFNPKNASSVSFVTPSGKVQKSIDFFNKKPHEIALDFSYNGTNHGLAEGAFKFVPRLEKVVKSLFTEALEKIRDESDDMFVKASFKDALTVLNISQHIYNGNVKKAVNSSHVDTSLREMLPSSYWDLVVSEPKKINAQDEKAKELLGQYTHTISKKKLKI